MSVTRPYNVYTRQLFKLGLGHPLWYPEPGRAGEVEVADVGIIIDGAFHRLFNATRAEPIDVEYGLPEDFQPLSIKRFGSERRECEIRASTLHSSSLYDVQIQVGGGS